jgi:hypothetical protein
MVTAVIAVVDVVATATATAISVAGAAIVVATFVGSLII